MTEMFRLDIQLPDSIADDTPLTGATFDLDSLDLLELAMCIEEEFGIAICSDGEARTAFRSVSSLADFIHVQIRIGQERRPVAGPWAAGGTAISLPSGAFARGSFA